MIENLTFIDLIKEQINNTFRIYHIKEPNEIKITTDEFITFEFYTPKFTTRFLHEFKKLNNFIDIKIIITKNLHCEIKLIFKINEDEK